MSCRSCGVLVIGGGPAGLAAAVTAAENGASVILVDESPHPGGQIWRAELGEIPRPARSWVRRVHEAGVEILPSTSVWDAESSGRWSTSSGPIRADRTILACGSRELLLPFPGWTKAGVFGAGGIQALVHSGLDVRGRRIVLAGTGPLLLQVASRLVREGAHVARISEQADLSRLLLFSLRLGIGKLVQAAVLADRSFRWAAWPVEAGGGERVESVRLRVGGSEEEIGCDYLAVGFGLVANLEIPRALGARLEGGVVWVDGEQNTSVDGVLAAGEICGVKGSPGALADGVCAGYVATGGRPPRKWLRRRDRERRFGSRLARAFALRDEVRELGRDDTELCRCESVGLGAVRSHSDWSSAKLHSRCGMGLCQGRICGAATESLFGWGPRGSRPPLTPTSIGGILTRGGEILSGGGEIISRGGEPS